ncbi:glycosyltransferase family 4 protein [Adlercreutzia sp. ZJ242]|uniref:glycosyltransferase n=1 Tax=Adlercreutzia sp. ZJ242 TaxID=2709409 RepID=UPI00197D28FA|nr:glycosyltransferase family 4 protein [Adlercreutzia sp. ZJ242]
MIAYRAARLSFKRDVPVLVEAMGCAWDAYWNHGLYGKIVAPYMYFEMKYIVSKARYVLYVTERFLQERYPCSGKSCHASNVDIKINNDLVLKDRLKKLKEADFTAPVFMTVAAVNVKTKGQQYVIEALALLKKRGIEAKYMLVGGGDQSYLKQLAVSYGVESQTVFTGNVPHLSVLELLDKCDVYIQPSLQEGLPRSVIEAMSRGCLCLGSETGGTPELLKVSRVFRRRSARAISESFFGLKDEKKELLTDEVVRNHDVARQYDSRLLEKRRKAFFSTIEDEITKKKMEEVRCFSRSELNRD